MTDTLSNGASDAAQSLADSLNKGNITGWDVAAAAVAILVCIPLSRLGATTVRRALRRAGIASSDIAADFGRVTKWLVYLCGFAVALAILGVNIGFLSVAFAFALVIGALMLKPMVENSASGILLAARPSFSVGDQIETTVFRGTVEEIGSRATRLRTQDGIVVYVSNNQVLGNPIQVYSKSDSRKALIEISIPAQTDLDDATSKILSAVASVDDVVDDPSPAVQAVEVVYDTITLSVSYWFPSTMESSSDVTDAVIRATMPALTDAGIQLTPRQVDVTQTSAPGTSGSGPADHARDSDPDGDSDDQEDSTSTS